VTNENSLAHPVPVQVQLGPWADLSELAQAIRFEVFVHEQQVPISEELDAMDPHCLHALAFDPQGAALGTGRLLPDGHIGRMAVRHAARKKGIGTAVLKALIEAAQAKGFSEVVLGAQLHAKDFYLKQGFVEFGEVFLDANIEHIMMRKTFRSSAL